MDAKEVIVAQAVANAELMVERDTLRHEVLNLRKRVEDLEHKVEVDAAVED